MGALSSFNFRSLVCGLYLHPKVTLEVVCTYNPATKQPLPYFKFEIQTLLYLPLSTITALVCLYSYHIYES